MEEIVPNVTEEGSKVGMFTKEWEDIFDANESSQSTSISMALQESPKSVSAV